MAKKAHPKNKSGKKSDTEDMPDVDTEDMDDGENGETEEVDEAPEETPDPEQPSPESGAGEPATNPPAGSPPTTTVKLKGEGTIPIIADGSMTRLDRGKNIKVTDAQLEALKKAGIEFKEV